MAKSLSPQRQALHNARDAQKRAELALKTHESLQAISSLGPEALQNSRTEVEAAAQQLAKRVSVFQSSLVELFETDSQEVVQTNGHDLAVTE